MRPTTGRSPGIFEAKGRPRFNPLIVHVPDMDAAEAVVRFDDRAERLAETLWPGALTLVLPRRPDSPLSLLVSAGLESVAVRVPNHPVARSLLKATGRPIAAPSANRSGAVSPTTPLHVAESLGSHVGLILASGRCPIGLESTVLDLTGADPILLRPGGVTLEELEALLGATVLTALGPAARHRRASPEVPRSARQPLRPRPPGPARRPRCRCRRSAAYLRPRHLRTRRSDPAQPEPQGDLFEAAANLFAMLRALDRPEHSAIAVMSIPEQGLGVAINDRLRRAAAPRGPATLPEQPLTP